MMWFLFFIDIPFICLWYFWYKWIIVFSIFQKIFSFQNYLSPNVKMLLLRIMWKIWRRTLKQQKLIDKYLDKIMRTVKNLPAMLDMVLAEANDVVEFLDHLLPFLLLFVLGKLLLDLSFSLQKFCKIYFLFVEMPCRFFTSNLLLKRHNHFYGHIENAQLRLWLIWFEVWHAHSTQLLECFVDITDSYSEKNKN